MPPHLISIDLVKVKCTNCEAQQHINYSLPLIPISQFKIFFSAVLFSSLLFFCSLLFCLFSLLFSSLLFSSPLLSLNSLPSKGQKKLHVKIAVSSQIDHP
jgi:hypothetical protein